MVEDILHNCRPQTRLCIAANITCEGEYIRTKTIKEWQGKVPDLTKIPCIFLLYQYPVSGARIPTRNTR